MRWSLPSTILAKTALYSSIIWIIIIWFQNLIKLFTLLIFLQLRPLLLQCSILFIGVDALSLDFFVPLRSSGLLFLAGILLLLFVLELDHSKLLIRLTNLVIDVALGVLHLIFAFMILLILHNISYFNINYYQFHSHSQLQTPIRRYSKNLESIFFLHLLARCVKRIQESYLPDHPVSNHIQYYNQPFLYLLFCERGRWGQSSPLWCLKFRWAAYSD